MAWHRLAMMAMAWLLGCGYGVAWLHDYGATVPNAISSNL